MKTICCTAKENERLGIQANKGFRIGKYLIKTFRQYELKHEEMCNLIKELVEFECIKLDIKDVKVSVTKNMFYDNIFMLTLENFPLEEKEVIVNLCKRLNSSIFPTGEFEIAFYIHGDAI